MPTNDSNNTPLVYRDGTISVTFHRCEIDLENRGSVRDYRVLPEKTLVENVAVESEEALAIGQEEKETDTGESGIVDMFKPSLGPEEPLGIAQEEKETDAGESGVVDKFEPTPGPQGNVLPMLAIRYVNCKIMTLLSDT